MLQFAVIIYLLARNHGQTKARLTEGPGDEKKGQAANGSRAKNRTNMYYSCQELANGNSRPTNQEFTRESKRN